MDRAMRVKPSGSVNAPIAIVGEAPGSEEEQAGEPFVGKSGWMLDALLRDARLAREMTFITNVTHDRPPNNDLTLWVHEKAKAPDDTFIKYRGKWVTPHIRQECERLYQELRAVQPNVVIALGNTALWALCRESGVAKWRGSHLISDAVPGLKVIPTYHPAAILKQYSWKWITTQDFRRAKEEALTPLTNTPSRSFLIGPTFEEAKAWLQALRERLDRGPTPFTLDLEISRKDILCVGIGVSSRAACCLPFVWTQGWYWNPEQHTVLVSLLREILLHQNSLVINQNLSFDIQYLFWRFFVRPKAHFDTMIAQNLLFPGSPKDLAYIASMWCKHYVYWKDDGKFWREYIEDKRIWEYNCLDCCYTFEVYERQEEALAQCNLTSQMAFQMRTFENLMDMMLRGVRVDPEAKSTMFGELNLLISRLHSEADHMACCTLRGETDFSPKKMAEFFYDTLKFPPVYKKLPDGRYSVTCDDEALKKIARKQPWIRPLTDRINMVRSYKTAVDVCKKRVDNDGRWRTSYNVAGTSTFRLASAENPFDSGLNLQNLTTGRWIVEED